MLEMIAASFATDAGFLITPLSTVIAIITKMLSRVDHIRGASFRYGFFLAEPSMNETDEMPDKIGSRRNPVL
jgi:hypothetical protein